MLLNWHAPHELHIQQDYAVQPPIGKLEFSRQLMRYFRCRYILHSTELWFRKQNIYNMGNTSEKFQVR